ncbi:L,D-transpeptidase family protein [Lacticaseibacillus hulanensis]|uniref:L,D-transpeptidase family protein n=1 Tax=Lacticaseibacillus hulanensis TaxID=2493111 RepID=UPI0013E2B76D|nr:L,D-transpeptidase family protein [Lacticaseibacillus hulanensis]
MQKKHWLAIAAAAVIVIAGGYIYGGVHYQGRYLPNTAVLGVNVSGKTTKQAESTLKTKFQQRKYTLTDNGKALVTASSDDLGISHNFAKTAKEVKAAQNSWSWPLRIFGSERKVSASTNPAVDEQTLKDFATTTAAKLNKNRKASTDASMKFVNGKLQVTKEVNGDKINADKLQQQLLNMVDNNGRSVNLSATYDKAKVTTTSKEFESKKQALANYSQLSGKLTVANHSETISPAKLTSWLGYANGKITVSETGVRAFVSDFANKYNTISKSRQFKSTKRGTVTVPAGNYGWAVSEQTTTNNLIADIKKGKNFTLAATTNGSGYHADGSDIGNTYVEVDIQNQHEWYYKNGKLVMDSDVVTGNPSTKHDTPTGVYFIWSKQRNATLHGNNADGSKYASPVAYWMPIDYTGVGLHDSPWQPKYGGDWYKQHGSHGCVNNPPAFVAKLYNAVSVGTPVIVF